MAKTIKIYSLQEFKELKGAKELTVRKSSTSDYYYATNSDGVKVAGVSPEVLDAINEGKELIVLQLEELGDTWFLIVPKRYNPQDAPVAKL